MIHYPRDRTAKLPSNRGGLNLRSAVLHAPAAFISSAASTKTLVEHILNRPTNLDAYLEKAVSALSSSSSHPEWLNLDDIDIPLRQRHLSCAIDEAMYQNLLDTSPSTRARALANLSALPHAGDWLNGVPSDVLGLHMQDREFNSCLKYWLGSTVPPTSAQHVAPPQTSMVTIKLAVVEMETESPATIRSEMSFFQPLNLQLLDHPARPKV